MRRRKWWKQLVSVGFAVSLTLFCIFAAEPGSRSSFRFVLLGDRTGETQPGVYEQIWREAAAEHPAFVLSVGDTIQGLDDSTSLAQWRDVSRIFRSYPSILLYLAPGNHDIWSPESETLFQQFAGHAPHYSFDRGPLHVTVLDNSRSEQFTTGELQFLERDLEAHQNAPIKLIVSHRPSWLIPVVFRNTASPVQQLAKRFGVKYVVAGHVHQMLHFELDGVTYLSLPSAGGHLRGSKRYEDGWFFGHTLVERAGDALQFRIEEAKPPVGKGRTTSPSDWNYVH